MQKMLSALLLCAAFVGCVDENSTANFRRFSTGQFVVHKLSRREGQVIYLLSGYDRYRVRFVKKETLIKDGEILATNEEFELLDMRGFELEPLVK